VKTRLCLLFAAFFAASLIALLDDSSANAAPPVNCSGTIPVVSLDEKFRDWSPSAFGDTFFTSGYSSSTDGLFFYKNGSGGNYLYTMLWSKSGPIDAREPSLGDYRFYPASPYYVEGGSNFNYINVYSDTSSSGGGGSNFRVNGYEIECVYGYQGQFTYNENWTSGDVFNQITEPEPPVDEPCDPFDIACWFGGFVGTIVDGFQGLADLFTGLISTIADFIANLIMPRNEEGQFENRFTDFFGLIGNTIHDRLGFLLFPFDFIASIFAQIASVWTGSGGNDSCANPVAHPGYCELTIPHIFADQDITFNLGAFEQKMPELWDVITTVIRFMWVVGLVAFLHSKYFSVVKE